MSELLDLEPLLTKPVRNLSLGERMKCELAGALLHRPRVLFLDEPTLGLDVTAQRRIRGFIAEYAARYDATVLLTSHYMADVEALAERVIVIHHGALLFDGALGALVERFSPHKTVIVDLERAGDGFERYGEVVAVEGLRATLRVPKTEAAAVTARLLAELPVVDLSVTDPPIDEVIDTVFSSGEEPMVEVPPAPQTRACTRTGTRAGMIDLLDLYRAQFKTTIAEPAPISRRARDLDHRADPATGHLPLGLVDGRRNRRAAASTVSPPPTSPPTTSSRSSSPRRHSPGSCGRWSTGSGRETLSPLLVRPVHPIHRHIANNLTFKLLTMAVVVPVVVVLTIVFRPNFTISAWTALAFVPALVLAMALRFAVEWTLASARVLGDASQRDQPALLRGVPLPVRVRGAARPTAGTGAGLADWLPFYRMLGFPVELLLGRLSLNQVLVGFRAQLGWLAIALLLLNVMWARGVRQYSAVGA